MTPRVRPVTQVRLRDLAAGPGAIILCGRFEGYDHRIFEARAIEPVSMGDILLSGGEAAPLLLLAPSIRLLPVVMGPASKTGSATVRERVYLFLSLPGVVRSLNKTNYKLTLMTH